MKLVLIAISCEEDALRVGRCRPFLFANASVEFVRRAVFETARLIVSRLRGRKAAKISAGVATTAYRLRVPSCHLFAADAEFALQTGA